MWNIYQISFENELYYQIKVAKGAIFPSHDEKIEAQVTKTGMEVG